MTGHAPTYRRIGRHRHTVACECGWVSERLDTRRDARAAHALHTFWLEDLHRPAYGPVGRDARRRDR